MQRFCLLTVCAALLGSPAAVRSELVNALRAVVHDAVITHAEVRVLTEDAARELLRQYRSQPDVFQKKVIEAERDNVEQLMERQLIIHEFSSSGYNLPESVVDDIVEEQIRAQFGDRMTATKTLEARGITFEKFRKQVRERFILRAMRDKNIAQEIIISPHKIEVYYEAHKEEYKIGDELKIQMLQINRAPDTDPAQSRKLAQEILGRLNEGAAFEVMAGMYSQRQSPAPGGEWWERSKLRKELADAVANLKAGERSGVIETPDACYIVKVEETRPARYKPLNEVRDDIEKILLIEERERLTREWVAKLRKKTYTKYY
jgi:parvulin-like peptidyl-prolyl isomerase